MSRKNRVSTNRISSAGTAHGSRFSAYLYNSSVATATATGYYTGYVDGRRSIAEILSEDCEGEAMTLRIHRLSTRDLKVPIDVLIETDAEGFIAKTPDLPLYGYGDDREEAIGNLKKEIETLFDDLMVDDNFSEEWLRIKNFLRERIAN